MRVLLALLGVLLVFAVPGCGETVLDTAKTEEALKANIGHAQGTKVTSVDCPSDEKVEPGNTFTCRVALAGGKEETATLEIVNKDADVHVIELSETSQQGQ
jgi:Domain of unknown function (DUF4333)